MIHHKPDNREEIIVMPKSTTGSHSASMWRNIKNCESCHAHKGVTMGPGHILEYLIPEQILDVVGIDLPTLPTSH